jgi:hypothetical protein
MGSCHESIRPGDEIHVLSGAKMPFVLHLIGRQEYGSLRKHYTIHGQAYLYGFMDGEALQRKGFGWAEICVE